MMKPLYRQFWVVSLAVLGASLGTLPTVDGAFCPGVRCPKRCRVVTLVCDQAPDGPPVNDCGLTVRNFNPGQGLYVYGAANAPKRCPRPIGGQVNWGNCTPPANKTNTTTPCNSIAANVECATTATCPAPMSLVDRNGC
jgi:hypothetical protein